VGQHGFTVTLERVDGYEFRVDAHDIGVRGLTVDEAPPLGAGEGLNPTRMLGAAVGHCLAASLLFCLTKAKIDVGGVNVSVNGAVERNERGRLRITRIDVTLRPQVSAEDALRVSRCSAIFDDYCIVTQSVRRGVEVNWTVEPVVTEELVPEEPGLAIAGD
jgi:organic hydroperoxide reductase OsmC/OhrA